MKLCDLLDCEELAAEIVDGYVNVRTSVDGYSVYNYAKATQFEQHWNPITLACRGIITKGVDGEVVARPFPKFWGPTEQELAALDITKCRVYPKMDGSLGIVYEGNRVSTRGSTESDMAKHAEEWLAETFPHWRAPHGVTCLFEIIYPENRIVVDYGTRDEMVLLACIDIETGADLPLAVCEWPGTVVQEVPDVTNLDELLSQDVRGVDAEGYVVVTPEGARFKLKFADYLRLHALREAGPVSVWKLWCEGGRSGVLEYVPDEFHALVVPIVDMLESAYSVIDAQARAAFGGGNKGWKDRREFARYAVGQEKQITGLLFCLYDGAETKYRSAIQKLVRPKGEVYAGV